jgi:enoyl-CoA hydratase/carnithine racemase
VGLIRRERADRHLVLELAKARANAIDAPLVEELIAAAAEAAGDDGVSGVLLASSHPRVFCPGLDLVSLVELERAAMRAFMLRFAEAVWALYALPKPVVAAVHGHAVAGGCILALAADWRCVAGGAQVGLNEVKVGVPLPWSVALLLRNSVAPPFQARVALLGRNFDGEEAVAAGLADEVLASDGFRAACLRRLAEFTDKDAYAFARTKGYLRSEALGAMRAHEAQRIDEWLDAWFSAGTRDRIRRTVEALGGKGEAR